MRGQNTSSSAAVLRGKPADNVQSAVYSPRKLRKFAKQGYTLVKQPSGREVFRHVSQSTLGDEYEYYVTDPSSEGHNYHREDGPAYIRRNRYGIVDQYSYYRDGKLHREDGPAQILNHYHQEKELVKRECWYRDGQYHADGSNPRRVEYHEDGSLAFMEWGDSDADIALKSLYWDEAGNIIEVNRECIDPCVKYERQAKKEGRKRNSSGDYDYSSDVVSQSAMATSFTMGMSGF